MHAGHFYAYIVASRSRTLYIGVTNDLERRIFEHKCKLLDGFTANYNCNRLVLFEMFGDPGTAIAREKQLKGWRREKKIGLINKANPAWMDLSEAWWTPQQLLWIRK